MGNTQSDTTFPRPGKVPTVIIEKKQGTPGDSKSRNNRPRLTSVSKNNETPEKEKGLYYTPSKSATPLIAELTPSPTPNTPRRKRSITVKKTAKTPKTPKTPQESPSDSPTPKTATPKTATPKTATPKTSTPKTATPKTATPKTATPKTSTAKTATPKTATPKTATPKTASLKTTTPKTVTPKPKTKRKTRRKKSTKCKVGFFKNPVGTGCVSKKSKVGKQVIALLRKKKKGRKTTKGRDSSKKFEDIKKTVNKLSRKNKKR